MLECESANNPLAKWDSGKAYWICQMHSSYHDIPQQYYDDWKYQVEYCYEKYKGGTKFYWPSRMINWVRCSDYVKDRFVLEYNIWDWWKDISDNKKLLWFMNYSNYRWKNKYLYWRPWSDHCNYKGGYWMTEEWMKTFLIELKEEYTKDVKRSIDYLEKQDIVYYIG